MRKYLPPSDHFLDVTLPGFSNYRIINKVDSGFNAHVYRAHSDEVAGDLAFKFVPQENLSVDPKQSDIYLEEARKANLLENESVVRCINALLWEDDKLGNTFVVFIFQYVPGLSLREYIKKYRDDINVPFVEKFLTTMFSLLFELDLRGMKHGDLHSGNVLVSKSEFDLTGRPTFKVTDFGVAGVTAKPHTNDYLSIAHTLKDLLSCIDYQKQQSRDRYVLSILRDDFLKRHLIETDSLADSLAQNAKELDAKLRTVDNSFQEATREHTSAKMVTPFDYPNCEQMGNSHLLLRNLYSDRLLGLTEIQARSNLVLTGPRGCGKTTVFRALSLDYKISTESDNPDQLQFIGVYYRCDDLYFSFPRYELPERQEAIDIPMHFAIVSLMAETLRHVSFWAKKYFEEEFEKKEPEVTKELWEIIGLTQPPEPSAGQFTALIDKLVKQRDRAAKKQQFCHVPEVPIKGYMGPEVLLKFCSALRKTFTFLQERPFFYFIDDYSTPKITEKLQQNLNRLFMHRSADVFFKLSTESPISFERKDVDEKQYVEEREYYLLNLGLRYLESDSSQVQSFLEDLFQRRFHEVKDFPCDSLMELLGDNPRNENDTARQFRERKGQNTYWGVQTVTAMCSGDIHYMIRLVGKMVEDVGDLSSSEDVPRISSVRQSRTIRTAAGEFIESVRNLPRHGEKLALIISTLGNVASSYMRYRNARNEKGNPPHQASRIEPYEALHLSDDAQHLLNDLIRFSILMMDSRGKSRRGDVVPRLYLRRYLLPYFNLTFSKRDSIQLENDEIELLLTDPSTFEKRKRIKSANNPRVKRKDSKTQKNLFDRKDNGR
ncbi:MAG: protein kinase [Gammaproteobacteria bacterium]|nr:protein kinase [Gammaproteobacteria bacterium]